MKWQTMTDRCLHPEDARLCCREQETQWKDTQTGRKQTVKSFCKDMMNWTPPTVQVSLYRKINSEVCVFTDLLNLSGPASSLGILNVLTMFSVCMHLLSA